MIFMFEKIKKSILKQFYKLLIFKVIVIDRSSFANYDNLKVFCEYELMSNLGIMKFIFKEDRRKKKRKSDSFLFLNSFLIELKVPDNLPVKRQEINEKVIIVIKLIFINVNYEILSEVLLDLYVEHIFKYLNNTEPLTEMPKSK